MRLALFDLDFTLIPFDSGMAWTRHLVVRGRLPREAEAVHVAAAQAYMAGTLDICGLHHTWIDALARFDAQDLRGWLLDFETEMRPRLPAPRRALLRSHLDAGDLCAIVTATPRPVAEPFARGFGIEHLIASEVPLDATPRAFVGDACHGAFKPPAVAAWLARRQRTLSDFERVWFYSDSSSDLPLLQAVTDPVAVAPDARLRAHALAQGWAILD